MSTEFLIPALALATLGLVIIFAIRSRSKVEEERHDPDAPKSALAKDGPTGKIDERL
ncbi:hypothetical protein [Jannaschia ovalis]|uniref:PEP-CTERM protein-sorting domain-containing protein n=1 Tax=Jannaschia ovalis TaxID=3038773 RepID=A0ABY8L8M5_9RHOB|nr:hypothetical protein [Jannaschia sp. GRR-S6-38]WGH77711.1 hypothetical protein P8627_11775 [Jannaschia sp. GRR-S6-38]